MTNAILSEDQLSHLRRFDTPTVSNAINTILKGSRQNFTRDHLYCAFPSLPSFVGYAKTATMRGVHPCPLSKEEESEHELRYWTYVAEGPRPTISVIQDLDGKDAGYASIWGEVNATIHFGFGCVGTVTDGGIRDLDSIPPGFQLLATKVTPFGSWSHYVDFGCTVNVCGMQVHSGDLIHADRHGAVVVPTDRIPELFAAIERVFRREKPLIDAAKEPNLTVEKLRAAHVARSKF